jgi:hypothetical protein
MATQQLANRRIDPFRPRALPIENRTTVSPSPSLGTPAQSMAEPRHATSPHHSVGSGVESHHVDALATDHPTTW